MIVLATEENLQLLSNAGVWLANGTFKISPPLFTQLYIVHGLVNNPVVPLVYALLPNKTMNTYERLFQIKRDNIVDFGFSNGMAVGPKTMIFGFELAAIGGAKKSYNTLECEASGGKYGLLSFGQPGNFRRN